MKKLLSLYYAGLRSHFIAVGYSGMDDEADIVALMVGSIWFATLTMNLLFTFASLTFTLQYGKIVFIVSWLTFGLFSYFFVIKNSEEYKVSKLKRYTLLERIYCILIVVSPFILALLSVFTRANR